jgi:hypothetical protein
MWYVLRQTHRTEEQQSETTDNFQHFCSIGESKKKMTPGEENQET